MAAIMARRWHDGGGGRELKEGVGRERVGERPSWFAVQLPARCHAEVSRSGLISDHPRNSRKRGVVVVDNVVRSYLSVDSIVYPSVVV